MRAGLERWLSARWYGRRPPWFLLPAALLFGVLLRLRRGCYRLGLLRAYRAPLPVVVVGNLTVGGSGKTPLVAWLCDAGRELGLKTGIVTRGYGGRGTRTPQPVRADSDPAVVGDEAVMLAAATGARVVACRDRPRAVRALEGQVDLVIADDGLQHYALARDLEIVVLDAERGLGNGWLLPAGPLREPPSRLRTADLVLRHGPGGDLELVPGAPRPLARRPAAAAPGGREVHAVAGIGHPARFFRTVRAVLGVDPVPHAFPDHHPYRPSDLARLADACVVMTSKDAVKCRAFAGPDWWELPVHAELAPGVAAELRRRLRSLAAALPGTRP